MSIASIRLPQSSATVLERKGFRQNSDQMGDTSEDTIRNLFPPDRMIAAYKDGYQQNVDWLNGFLDSEGLSDAVFGSSHGPCVVKKRLGDRIRRSQSKGSSTMLKLRISLCGLRYNMKERPISPDVDGKILKVPTIHVSDPLIDFALDDVPGRLGLPVTILLNVQFMTSLKHLLERLYDKDSHGGTRILKPMAIKCRPHL
ncbi:MAG: hypothetical protein Q9216_005211 [Gyalolechia sp. 2 TL-2023]